MNQVGQNSFNYLIYHKLIIFNILKILLIYKSSFVLSTYKVSNDFSSVNFQVFRGRKSGQFLVVFTVYYCILKSPEKYREVYIFVVMHVLQLQFYSSSFYLDYSKFPKNFDAFMVKISFFS